MRGDPGPAPDAARGAVESWTVRRMASWMAGDFAARGIDSARLDAELLLAHALGCERLGLYLDLERPLSRDELSRVRELVRRRRAHEPVAYVVGHKEFWGRRLEVSPDVLVPRPETELLVEVALGVGTFAHALDLCTGSGAVAIALAAERSDAHVDATDRSAAALVVARRNLERHALVDRIALHEGDLFDALPTPRRYDLVTANPPYLAEGEWQELPPDVRDHEPRSALVAGPSGLELHARIAAGVGAWLAPAGLVLVEVGAGQAPAVAELLRATGLDRVDVHRDLRGIERVVSARRGAVPR